MPIYEFQCKQGHVTSEFVSHRTVQQIICPICYESDDERIDTCAYRILSPTPGIVKNPAVPRRAK